MSPVQTVGDVFNAIQQAKAGAPAFCTNFFPVQTKLQGWIDHGELLMERRDGAALFLRRDRDFYHLYFCAASPAALWPKLFSVAGVDTERVVVDLVGPQPALVELTAALEPAGLKCYTRLQRMSRTAQSALPQAGGEDTPVTVAERGDSQAILALLEFSFDRYADQLPQRHEVEAAIEARQMLVVKNERAVAALLFFETQGFTSTLRYWAVAERFRSRRFGGAVMRQYFAGQSAVRRFLLWVVAGNKNAVEKYQHYGYAPDGLLDQVLVNERIASGIVPAREITS
ncbi:MAG TPA: hypothetical protein VN578_20915 [Candidatus Binatia bacterium]|jgi:hypothetical protein|nr:hypothetical protein [Candidatus Binatia bacterium]